METNTGTVGGAESAASDLESQSGPRAQAQRLMNQGKDKARAAVDDNKARVARTLSSVASALKTSSADMQSGDAAAIGNVVDRVADQVDRAANYLERSQVDELVSGVEQFARRNPALFIGAAFAVGVLGARFLKSSRTDVVTYDGSTNLPSTVRDREVTTTPIGSADLSTGLE